VYFEERYLASQKVNEEKGIVQRFSSEGFSIILSHLIRQPPFSLSKRRILKRNRKKTGKRNKFYYQMIAGARKWLVQSGRFEHAERLLDWNTELGFELTLQ
jgi:hypothetical protein